MLVRFIGDFDDEGHLQYEGHHSDDDDEDPLGVRAPLDWAIQ